MSWLSEIFKAVKSGRSDAELAFDLLVSRMSSRQRQDLWQQLSAVQFAVDVANRHIQDPRVETARQWVGGALAILEGRK